VHRQVDHGPNPGTVVHELYVKTLDPRRHEELDSAIGLMIAAAYLPLDPLDGREVSAGAVGTGHQPNTPQRQQMTGKPKL
jgi:hypothetical protein